MIPRTGHFRLDLACHLSDQVDFLITPRTYSHFDWRWSGRPRAYLSSRIRLLSISCDPSFEAGLTSKALLPNLIPTPLTAQPCWHAKDATDDIHGQPVDGVRDAGWWYEAHK